MTILLKYVLSVQQAIYEDLMVFALKKIVEDIIIDANYELKQCISSKDSKIDKITDLESKKLLSQKEMLDRQSIKVVTTRVVYNDIIVKKIF